MQYKCIKDFWMDGESTELGHTPAFVEGVVYDFDIWDDETLVTYRDNHNRHHHMDKDELDNSGYFELVEEKQMSNLKWEEGKTYKFKVDMIEKFKATNHSNTLIADLIGLNVFTVKRVRVHYGVKVVNLVEFNRDELDIEYWFDGDEIRYFELVEDTTEESLDMTNTNNIRPDSDIVVEWLGKLIHVLQVDQSVDDSLNVTPAGISLHADYGTIYGPVSICNFITNRYDLLQQEAKHKKNNELIERKAKLEAELADVNKQLSEVK